MRWRVARTAGTGGRAEVVYGLWHCAGTVWAEWRTAFARGIEVDKRLRLCVRFARLLNADNLRFDVVGSGEVIETISDFLRLAEVWGNKESMPAV